MKQVKQQFPCGILVISSIILSSAPHAHLSDHFKFPPHYWILTDSISHAAQILQHLPTTPGGETQALALGWDSATSFDPPTDPQSWSDGYIHFSCINPPITQQTEQLYLRDSWFGLLQLCASAKTFTICLKNLCYEHWTVTTPSRVVLFHTVRVNIYYVTV